MKIRLFLTSVVFLFVLSTSAHAATLSKDVLIEKTNAERIAEGVSKVTSNTTLNEIAEEKLADMFTRWYFNHVTPEGTKIGAHAKENGYTYSIIGENLAIGIYGSDQEVIDTWMESGGHRANILNERFSEIGLAVDDGTYKGEYVWMVVQVFADPQETCPEPSDALARRLTAERAYAKRAEEMLHFYKDVSAHPNAAALQPLLKSLSTLLSLLVKEINKRATAYAEEIELFETCARHE